jgi:hypothetical protein
MKEIPKTLGELLVAVVKDCKHVEKLKTVSFDMTHWMKRRDPEGKTCNVCMAGAYLRQSRGVRLPDGESYLDLFSLPRRMVNVCCAINSVRLGQVRDAIFSFYRQEGYDFAQQKFLLLASEGGYRATLQRIEDEYWLGTYHASWEAYLELAKLLKKHGI